MDLFLTAAIAGGILSWALAVGVLAPQPRQLAQWSLAGGLGVLGVEAVFIGLSFHAADPEQVAQWQTLKFMAAALLPGPWLVFSLSFSQGNCLELIKKARWFLAILCAAPVVAAFGFSEHLVVGIEHPPGSANWFLRLGWSGFVIDLLALLSAVAILMNLERTFSASVGTMRWRIKYMVIGVGLIWVVRLYTSSQSLLYSANKLSLQTIHLIALWLAGAMMVNSVWRTGRMRIEVYPSQSVLRHSVTVLLAGVYLLAVGVLAKIVAFWGGNEAFSLQALLVLLGLVGFSAFLLSERVREQTRRFVSRHFKRPHYDYRQVWSTFTERSASLMERAAFCRAMAQWVAETFNALSVTIWLVEDLKPRLVFGASTALAETQAQKLLAGEREQAEVIHALGDQAYPVDLETAKHNWVDTLRRFNPDTFGRKGGNRVCVPLAAKRDLLGLMILGDRVNGIPFTVEDFDLLKCIGDQVGSHLLNLKLSGKILEAKQMEAFQTMSAFFVHDLKNTASTLSLMLQNLPQHFADPAFREDALRGLGKSVTRINELISRLSALRQDLKLKPAAADLNEVVSAALNAVEGLKQVRLAKSLEPLPKIPLDQEQLQKAIVNLAVNAVEAVGPDGQVQVSTARDQDWVVLSIRDNGCGMSQEFIDRSLFRPFQTTKKKGIGIGLFLSKIIIEAHGGKIEVESQPGAGATFRVMFPIHGAPK